MAHPPSTYEPWLSGVICFLASLRPGVSERLAGSRRLRLDAEPCHPGRGLRHGAGRGLLEGHARRRIGKRLGGHRWEFLQELDLRGRHVSICLSLGGCSLKDADGGGRRTLLKRNRPDRACAAWIWTRFRFSGAGERPHSRHPGETCHAVWLRGGV